MIFSRRGWRDYQSFQVLAEASVFLPSLGLDPSLGLSSWSYSTASPSAAPTQRTDVNGEPVAVGVAAAPVGLVHPGGAVVTVELERGGGGLGPAVGAADVDNLAAALEFEGHAPAVRGVAAGGGDLAAALGLSLGVDAVSH